MDIIKRIYETSHAVNNDDTIVFDFDKFLVNMVTDDEKLYDKIVNIWDEHRRERDNSKNSKNSKIVFINDMKNRSHRKIADQDDTNRDVADQGTTMNNRKVVNNRADQDEDMNTDTSDQETTSGNRDVVSNFEIDKDKDGIEDADRIVYLAILH